MKVSEELLKLGKVGPAHCSGIKSLIAEHKDKFLDAGVGKVLTSLYNE